MPTAKSDIIWITTQGGLPSNNLFIKSKYILCSEARIAPFRRNDLSMFCITAHQSVTLTWEIFLPRQLFSCKSWVSFLELLVFNISRVFKWTLWLGQSITPQILLFEPLLGRFASVLWIIISWIQVWDRWPYILLKHTLIWYRIHSWHNNSSCKQQSNPKS